MFRPLQLALTIALSVALGSPALAATEAAGTQIAVGDYSEAWRVHLRAERARQVDELRAYADAGVFPTKLDQQGFYHQFLDAKERPCAVAYLMWQSGEEPLVRATAQANNSVVLAQIDDGPLVDWMLTSGLLREEVAVIQVPGFNQQVRPSLQIDTALMQRTMEKAAEESRRLRRLRAKAAAAEKKRVQDHLKSVVALLESDTEWALWKAEQRLGDRVSSPPPSLTQVDLVAAVPTTPWWAAGDL